MNKLKRNIAYFQIMAATLSYWTDDTKGVIYYGMCSIFLLILSNEK